MKFTRRFDSRIASILTGSFFFAFAGAGCSGLNGGSGATPQDAGKRPHDPNEVVVQSGSAEDKDIAAANAASKGGQAPLSARTTLLEENEHLRDLLAKAQAAKRDAEDKLGSAESQCGKLTDENSKLKDSVAQLSEQLEGKTKQIEELESKKSRLEKDRTTLAQMYALEKRQRLAFEKELLEKEISDRTRAKDG